MTRLLAIVMMGALALSAPLTADESGKDKKGKDTKDTGTSIVVAEGVGTTADDALKDAFRNAVRQVVGAVVDAETLVKNDQIISDKVLTYSDGFVKNYDEISKNREKGLFRVRINAQVERRSVIAKLTEAKVTVKDVDGKGLFSEAITQEEAKKNATALLAKALADLPTLLTAEVGSKPGFDRATSEAIVNVRVKVDRKAYIAYQKKLEDLLKQISLRKDTHRIDAKPFSHNFKPVPNMFNYSKHDTAFAGPKVDASNPTAWCVWLNSFNNESHTTTRWDTYLVDADIEKTVKPLIMGKIILEVFFLDSDGKRLTENEFEVKWDEKFTYRNIPSASANQLPLLWYPVAREKDGKRIDSNLDLRRYWKENVLSNREHTTINLFICPYSFIVRGDASSFGGCELFYQTELDLTHRVKVSLDELKNVKSVECRVRFRH